MADRFEHLQKTLDPRHRIFAEQRALGLTLTEAADKAGYKNPRKHGSFLGTKQDISEYIRLLSVRAARVAEEAVCCSAMERQAALARIIQSQKVDEKGDVTAGATNREVIAAILAWSRVFPPEDRDGEGDLLPWAQAMLSVDEDLDRPVLDVTERKQLTMAGGE